MSSCRRTARGFAIEIYSLYETCRSAASLLSLAVRDGGVLHLFAFLKLDVLTTPSDPRDRLLLKVVNRGANVHHRHLLDHAPVPFLPCSGVFISTERTDNRRVKL